MKLLIVDDEELIRSIIKEYALIEDYKIDEASSGEEAIKLCKKNDYDLIVLDIMMPNIDGYETIKEIRSNKNTPIIILSAKTDEYDKLQAFKLGIDDYITKPFSPKELMARIKAILNRSKNNSDILKYGDLKIDKLAREVMVGNKSVKLTLKEYDLLKYLVENKNIVITRPRLLNTVWGFDFYGDNRTVDTHIKTLRKKIGKYKKNIITLRGVGYKFEYKE